MVLLLRLQECMRWIETHAAFDICINLHRVFYRVLFIIYYYYPGTVNISYVIGHSFATEQIPGGESQAERSRLS